MKKTTIVILLVIMVCSLFSQFAGGDGTSGDPYQIATASQLNSVRNYNGDPYSETYFLMMNDIDLSSYSPWVPMCSWFRGQFDGGNNVITGLNINLENEDEVGLFKLIDNGDVSNLTIESAIVTGREYVGIVCGSLLNGSISNCHTSGTVNGENYVGGITGAITGNANECSFSGDLIGNIVYNGFSQWDSGGQYIGGISGEHYSGQISLCYSTGTIKGAQFLGGLVGKVNGTVLNSYAQVSIYDETDYYGATSLAENLGGFTGYNSGSISNGYSTGQIDVTMSSGGLIGISTGTVVNSFWDITTSGRSDSAAGTGKTSAEMKTISTFTDAGWDFVGETANGTNDWWNINGTDNNGYPSLYWQTFDFNAPENVTVSLSGNDMIINWDINAQATSYSIYSSNDPYTDFPSGWNEETTNVTESNWTDVNISDDKKFYIVVGVK